MDDILTTAKNISELEARLKNLLSIKRPKNMKLALSKFQIGSHVVYGGTVLEASKQRGDDERSVYIYPTQEKLDAFLNF